MKNLETYKLGVLIDGDAAKGLAALKSVDAQVAKSQTGISGLTKQFKELFSHDTATAKAAGEKFAGSFVAGVSGGLGNIGQTLGTLIGTGLAPGIGTAVGSLVGSGIDKALGAAAGAIKDLISQGVDLNIFLEKAEVHFTALSGSVEKARAHLELMDKLEGQLGFDMRELVGQSQRLSEFNIPLAKMELYLRASADAAQAFGSGAEGFAQIGNTLGLMTEKGELTSKMLLKLERQGVPAMKYLAEATGLNAKQLKALADAGRLNGEVASEMIAQGIELHKGGAAQRITEQTTYGQRFRFEQNVEQSAGRATRSFTRDGLKGLYATGNAALESDLANGLTGSINSAVEGIVGSLKKGVAIGQSGGIGAGLKSVGGDVVGGLYAGIKGAEGLIAESSQWISETFVGFTKKAFGIQSPSQVTRDEIGKPLGQGVVEGLKDTSSDIYKAMQAIVDGAIEAGKATITGKQARGQVKGTGADLSRFQSIANQTGIPLNLLLAIGSRETNLKNILGDFRGGKYHGAGYMQVDVGTDKQFVESGAWKNADAAISRGAQILIDKLTWLVDHAGKTASVGGHKFTVPKLEGEALIQTAVASYNSGNWAAYAVSKGLSPDTYTTGKNYSSDTLGRAKLLAGIGGSSAGAPSGTPASPVAVMATDAAPVPVKLIFGGGVDAGTTFAALEKIPTELAAVAGAIIPHALEALPAPPALTGGGAGAGKAFGGFASAAQQANRSKLVRKQAGGIFAGSGPTYGVATDDDGNLLQGATASEHASAAIVQSLKKVGDIGKQSIGGLAQGIGSMVSNFVLMGETGPAALKKITAQVLASAAQESAVQAIMELAYGFATMFTDPAESAGHFTSAAIFASVAAATGIAGRAIAGDSFKNGGAGAGGGGGSSNQPNPWLGNEGYAANRFASNQNGPINSPSLIGYNSSYKMYTGDPHTQTVQYLLGQINAKLNPVNGQQMVLATLANNQQAVGAAAVGALNSNNQLSLRLGQRING